MTHEQIGTFGPHLLRLKPWASPARRREVSRDMLSRALNLRTTVAFLGSGCSSPLGYPNWVSFTKAVVDGTITALEQKRKQRQSSSPELDERVEYFGKFQRQLAKELRNPGLVDSTRLTYMLGACQKTFKMCDKVADYHRLLSGLFLRTDRKATGRPNPYEQLLKLTCIRRFITTNYDYEIEWALHEKRGIGRWELGLPEKGQRTFPTGEAPRSFTQKQHDPLALFALARVDEAENLVFHCHGICTSPETMIVTEEDYQRFYLSDNDSTGAGFRQTLEVLFSSNPILFIGFGLRDDDLLRPLRAISAADPERKATRPLFALLPDEEGGKGEEKFEQLYDRYGVHVIPYSVPKRAKGSDRQKGEALCEALEMIRREWVKGRAAWLKKPFIRNVELSAAHSSHTKSYYHYVQESKNERLAKRSERILRGLEKKIKEGMRFVALVGPGGTGKSWHALRLMERLIEKQKPPARKDYDGFFFWSSYYSDDSLTGLDRALRFMAPEEKGRRKPRLDRLSDCLKDKQKRYFLIFDGVERFLRESKDPAVGEASPVWIDEFFRRLADKDNHSTVVITSRLRPLNLPTGSAKETGVWFEDLPRLSTEEVREIEPFGHLPDELVSAFCSLLDGHIYGLVLAAEMLKAMLPDWENIPTENLRDEPHLAELKRSLSDTPPDGRVSRMIKEAVNAVDKEKVWCGLALQFLARLAIFMSPVREQTAELCYKLAAREIEGAPEGSKELVEILVKRRLLFRVRQKPGASTNYAYTVHPVVRGYVFQRVHGSGTDALPNFTLPGFTAGTAVVDPGSEQCVEMVERVFDELCGQADNEIELCRKAEEAGGKAPPESEANARVLCRDAFGVLRSRMESNTVPRWGNYERYVRHLLRLGDLIKAASGRRLWDYAEPQSLRTVQHEKGVLYADELAWLYNEIGLTYYSQSAMLDALGIWEQEYEINRIVDSVEDGGHYVFQALCNLGAANIHFGRLSIAEEYLRKAERINFRANDEDHRGRIMGYRALVQHLRGNLTEAETLYKHCLAKLRKVENHRAESIFYRHYSDLLIQLGQVDKAEQLMITSRALAEAADYPELAAYVRLTCGHIHRKRENVPKALLEYNAALSEARRIGIRRLEAEALSELSRLALSVGDNQVARQRAIESLKIANECLLGLRQTHGLVLLGLASIKGGERNLGAAYLKHAKKMADQQHYALRGREAEEELRLIGEMYETPRLHAPSAARRGATRR